METTYEQINSCKITDYGHTYKLYLCHTYGIFKSGASAKF
jgi:hypothetical protein